MKKNHLSILTVLALLTLAFSACTKEQTPVNDSQIISADATAESDSRMNGHQDHCRLVKSETTFGDALYTYNKNGLMDTYTIYYLEGGYFKHEYKFGRLIKAKFFDASNTNLFNIKFLYDKENRVYRELWYDGITNALADDVNHYYDKHGLRKKTVSPLLNYYITFKYDYSGNLTKWTFYDAGQPSAQGEYTYLRKLKNPTGQIPGLEYDYYSANGVYSLNKYYSTSEKFTVWDNGMPVVIEDQDPNKTIMTGNKQNFAIHAEYFDKLTPDPVVFDFTYANCESCKPHKNNNRYTSKASNNIKASAEYRMLRKPLRMRK